MDPLSFFANSQFISDSTLDSLSFSGIHFGSTIFFHNPFAITPLIHYTSWFDHYVIMILCENDSSHLWTTVWWHTGPITRFHKTNSKEAISMWPDMHSFYRFHTFEPIDFLLFSLRKVDHVLRFLDFTVSNCSTFYRFHKFGPILARICEFRKTSNQKLITWLILVRCFT